MNRLCHVEVFCHGYQAVGYNVIGYDWMDHNAEWMARNLIRDIAPGSIIFMHDALFCALDAEYFMRQASLDAVARVLASPSGQYRFVTIPELFALGRVRR